MQDKGVKKGIDLELILENYLFSGYDCAEDFMQVVLLVIGRGTL